MHLCPSNHMCVLSSPCCAADGAQCDHGPQQAQMRTAAAAPKRDRYGSAAAEPNQGGSLCVCVCVCVCVAMERVRLRWHKHSPWYYFKSLLCCIPVCVGNRVDSFWKRFLSFCRACFGCAWCWAAFTHWSSMKPAEVIAVVP